MAKKLQEIAEEGWSDAFAVCCAVGDVVIGQTTGFDLEVMGKLATLVDIGKSTKEAMEPHLRGVNPYFITHKVDELDTTNHSPKCKRYFKMRRIKRIGGSITSGVGSVLGSVTQVNVLGLARHGRAEASTALHLYRFHAMSKQVKQSRFLSDLIAVMIKAKGIKAGVRGAQFVSDTIPQALAGGSIISAVVGGVGSVAGGMAMKKMSGAITLAAIEMHWRAYQELKVGAAFGGGSGPAMRMIRELMNSPVLDKVKPLAGVPADVYIREPFGHLVIRDKLMLI